MAFRQCDSCDGLIASRATVCPHCDISLNDSELLLQPAHEETGSGSWVTYLFVLIVVVMLADLTGLMS